MSDQSGGREVNLGEMARLLGITTVTLRAKLRDNADFPVKVRGGQGQPWVFDPDAALAWWRRTQVTAAEKNEDPSPAQQKALWDAKRIEIQVRREAGELMDMATIKASDAAILGRLRKHLLQVPLLATKEFNLPRETRLGFERLIADGLNAVAEELRNARQDEHLHRATS